MAKGYIPGENQKWYIHKQIPGGYWRRKPLEINRGIRREPRARGNPGITGKRGTIPGKREMWGTKVRNLGGREQKIFLGGLYSPLGEGILKAPFGGGPHFFFEAWLC